LKRCRRWSSYRVCAKWTRCRGVPYLPASVVGGREGAEGGGLGGREEGERGAGWRGGARLGVMLVTTEQARPTTPFASSRWKLDTKRESPGWK
jgi:hypothetical protein